MKDLLKGEKCIKCAKQVQIAICIKKMHWFRANCLIKGLEMLLTNKKSSFSHIHCKGLKVILVCRSV